MQYAVGHLAHGTDVDRDGAGRSGVAVDLRGATSEFRRLKNPMLCAKAAYWCVKTNIPGFNLN
jgi:hypothetical protein